MKKLEFFEMEILDGGGGRCEVLLFMYMGMGVVLSTALVTLPVGIVVGALGAGLYAAGGCGN